MSAEIERKFLLPRPPAWLAEHPAVRIEQGYLAIDEEVEVRLRRTEEQRLLTAKRGHGEVREEIEIALGREQFDALWPLTERRRLIKTRTLVPLEQGLVAEVDVFEDELQGLLLGEVEFASAAQAGGFEPPGWLGSEITGQGPYAGQSLALHGLPSV